MAHPPRLARPILHAFAGLVPPADVLDAIRSGDAAGVALYCALNGG
ncbi:MAG: hypothetical protein LH650_08920 [Chloroflexi bacterium]|nr:hypothetical protein [Chloroflexota bacterium]